MNDSTDNVVDHALERALDGFRVFPLRSNDKRPAINAWPEQATGVAERIEAWWANGYQGSNLGIACGSTTVGATFFVIDIDVKGDVGGDQAWAELCAEHPAIAAAAERTVKATTPSGGFHLYFVLPEGFEVRNTQRLLPGVDVRGEGGYVVAPPSTLPNGQYRWERDPYEHEVVEAPQELLDLLAAPPESHSAESVRLPPSVVPSSNGHQGITPFEWMNREFDPYDTLLMHGWQPGGRRGDEEQLTRPGKSGREGTSATYHHDSGLLNIYSTSVDPIYEMVGIRQRDCITLKPADIWMVANGITDRSEASRLIREMMPVETLPPAPAVVVPLARETTPERAEGVASMSSTNLPPEFWESRALLSHIRQAAHARMASADAILGAVLARYSATVPVTYRIPAIVMSASTFDHMSVLVSESSGGKSGAAAIARELFPPVLVRSIRWDQPVGSGEGLVQLFYGKVQEENDKGKTVEVHKKVYDAVHFTADEGMALVQTSRRDSATIGSVLCSAWSGTQLGQANATEERRRIVEAGTGRVAGVCGIQLSLGHHFLADEWVRQGLSGRLVFFAAEDPSIPHPDDLPEWPGELDLPVHPKVPLELVYDAQIVSEVRRDHWQRTTGEVHERPLDGHQRLARLKISGLLALMDGRESVNGDDWGLASQILDSSTVMRDRMLAIKQHQERDAGHRRAVARGIEQDVAETVKERQAIARITDAIIRKVGDAEEGVGRNKLRKMVTSSSTKHRFDAALEQAIERGAVRVEDGAVHRA